jgi:hypothetical protein
LAQLGGTFDEQKDLCDKVAKISLKSGIIGYAQSSKFYYFILVDQLIDLLKKYSRANINLNESEIRQFDLVKLSKQKINQKLLERIDREFLISKSPSTEELFDQIIETSTNMIYDLAPLIRCLFDRISKIRASST